MDKKVISFLAFDSAFVPRKRNVATVAVGN